MINMKKEGKGKREIIFFFAEKRCDNCWRKTITWLGG